MRTEISVDVGSNHFMKTHVNTTPSFDQILKDTQDRVWDYVLSLPFATRKNQLPRLSGVYFLFDKSRYEFSYVGKAVDLRSRWQNRTDFAMCEDYPLYYKIGASEFFGSIETEEAFFITALRPRHNRVIRCSLDYHGYLNV